jgi:hypothetical protein
MENILISISNSNSIIVFLTGILTAIFPIFILLKYIIYFMRNVKEFLTIKLITIIPLLGVNYDCIIF